MRLLFLLPLTLAACNGFDPNLGDHPFRCGSSDPKCPDGYSCGTGNVCLRNGGGDGPDASNPNFTCNDDSVIEPNETIQQADPTPIPDAALCTSMIKLAICPPSDKDFFEFRINPGATNNMRATLSADLSVGLLDMKVLNEAGAVIGNASMLDGQTLEVKINNLAAAKYYIEVLPHSAGIENNYSLDILTCATSGCPGACTGA